MRGGGGGEGKGGGKESGSCVNKTTTPSMLYCRHAAMTTSVVMAKSTVSSTEQLYTQPTGC